MVETPGARFEMLVDIMRTLRSPQGCPWDREQTVESLRPFVLEETYEVLEAIDRRDRAALCEELGDFLFEAVFLAQICEEEGSFTIGDAIQSIRDKLVRRHPHVFTPEGEPLGNTTITSQQVKERWEAIKVRERDGAKKAERTLLSGVPRTMPALLRAYELSTRAATVGFDWVRATDVLDKIDEEVRELRVAIARTGARSPETEEELGDLFFALANLARKLGLEPESALRRANDKFQTRFEAVERRARDAGRELPSLTLEEMEAHWQAVKAATAAQDASTTKASTAVATETPRWTIERLPASAMSAAQNDLVYLLRACVDAGASVGFLAPMPEHEAVDFWSSLLPQIDAGSRALFVARDRHDGRIIGTGQLVFEWKPNGRHRAEVSKLLVLPSHRRRGIAAQIMAAIEHHASQHAIRLLFLDTSEGASGATGLYESLGYTYAGGIPDWALDPDGRAAKNAIYYKTIT
jgi:MazG family protein